MRRFLAQSSALLFALLISAAPSASAVQWVIENGLLSGAKDVSIGNKIYDVDFVDGSCNSVFSSCGSLPFSNATDAEAAANALLGQVFVNTDAGAPYNYDSAESAINDIEGCGAPVCHVWIPYMLADNDTAVVYTRLRNGQITDFVASGGKALLTHDLTSDDEETWARFTFIREKQVLPEPSSSFLILTGLSAVFVVRRRFGAQRNLGVSRT